MPPYSLGSRGAQLARLASESFDVLIVGGGITGAGIAWDAASRGLRVALIERADFASGTSSRSSKLIHGGLRYLAQGHLGLTREALGERGRLQRLAPHLVELLPFTFPVFSGVAERAKLTAGLWLYDAFAAGSGAPRHSWLDKAATLSLAPGLASDQLAGAFVYRDARTDDARLVVEVLRAAVAEGAAISNYLPMQGLLMAKGRIIGVAAEDQVTGEPLEIQARTVVLAAGVWLDHLLPPTSGEGRRVRPAKGVHLFLNSGPLPPTTALYLSTTSDGRLIFVVPWLGKIMVGTTDTPYSGDLATPRATKEDVRYLLAAVNRAFPSADLSTADVLSTQAGLRPLVSLGEGAERRTTSLSREERIFELEKGVIGVAGGKLTTFRRMAEKVVDVVAKRLADTRAIGSSRTAHQPLSGFARAMDGDAYVSWREAALAGLPQPAQAMRARLIARYGAHYPAVEGLVHEEPHLGEALAPGQPFLKAEALFAVRHEQAVTIGDVLAQRLRLSLLVADHGQTTVSTVADMLTSHHGWTGSRRKAAIEAYATEMEQYAVPVDEPAPTGSR